jgi:hypothetical protein
MKKAEPKRHRAVAKTGDKVVATTEDGVTRSKRAARPTPKAVPVATPRVETAAMLKDELAQRRSAATEPEVVVPAQPSPLRHSPERFFNRELSWLALQPRASLEEAF